MSAGLPLLVLLFLGSIVNLAWIFGRKKGRKYRIGLGSLLFVIVVIAMIVIGHSDSGIWNNAGMNAFSILWLATVAMFAAPIIERMVWRT